MMCGLFGVIGRHLPAFTLESVLQVLEHRGPDGTGVFIDKAAQVTFAHTRLAVIDLAAGAQPIQSDEGNIVLACNGEIYGFETIRQSLEAKGYCFKTRTDSEVIIYLYKEFGLSCFDRLRGEFAFLLYDRAKRLLIAGRDRFGIKPLYFSRLAGGFVFASEIKAIFASNLVTAKLNVAGLDPFLDQDPENVLFPFEGIEHVPPASYMLINLESCESTVTRYWSSEIPAVAAEPVSEPSGDASTTYEHLVLTELEEAVRLRLRADVPIGLYLSGGIDSSFVGALMQRNLKGQLHSFSISFVGSDKNEQKFARQAADFLQTDHHELAVTKKMLWDHLEDCLWFSELPFVSLAPVGKFLLSKAARKLVTVVLTGEGADEVFLGYRGFFQKAIRDTRNPYSRRGSPSGRFRRLNPRGHTRAMLEKFSVFIFHKSQRRRLAMARASAGARAIPSRPVINVVQETRVAAMPLDVLCFLGDREEMAHSLEARLPFLDHKLYEAAKRIPVDFKMRNGIEKAVLRDAAAGILPEDLRLRAKSGFMTTSDPVDFFGADREMTEKLRDLLSKEAFERAQVFSYRAYLLIRLLAKAPAWKSLLFVRRLRRNANKAIMYMIQTHLLHEMFIVDPRWQKSNPQPTDEWAAALRTSELVS